MSTRETLVFHLAIYLEDSVNTLPGQCVGNRTPWESLKGKTPDISALIDFELLRLCQGEATNRLP